MSLIYKYLAILHLTFRGILCVKSNIQLDNFRDTLISEYKRFRQEIGCDAPLCNNNNYSNNQVWTQDTDVFDNFSNSSGNYSCCSNCSCSKDCERFGDCCPDKLPYFPNASDYPVGGIFECGFTTVKETPRVYKSRQHMISRCSPSYEAKDVIKQCLTPKPEELKGYQIVSDRLTKEAYKNIYCARCNHKRENEVIVWNVKIECQKGVFIPHDIPSLILEIRNSNVCNIVFEPPAGYDMKPCNEMISRCNITGLWRTNNTFVHENACNAFISKFRSKNKIFKNSFCYICNFNDFTDHTCEPESHFIHRPPIPNEIVISFSALLDFKEYSHESINTKVCPEKYVYDYYMNVCREIICPPLKMFIKGSCHRVINSTRGLIFEATIKLSTSQLIPGRRVLSSIKEYFDEVSERCNGEVNVTVEYCNSSRDRQIQEEFFTGYFIVIITFNDDVDFVDSLLDFDGISIHIDNYEYSELENINETNAEMEQREDNRYSIIKQRYVVFKCEVIDNGLSYLSNQENIVVSGRLVVSKFLQCQMIELDLDNFKISRNNSGIFLHGLNMYLAEKDTIYTNTSMIRLCAKNYILATEEFGAEKDTISVKSILSLVAVCCSVVCLIITIVVYGSLPELRTQPGTNNKCLSVSLLLAFVCFIIGGIRTLQGIWCSLIGLMVHFLWLNNICWLNICCFHMFRTFGSVRLPTQNKTKWFYHAYCLIVSTILVNINIICSLNTSHGRNIGYGKHSSLCYIIYPQMIAYVMTLPTSLIVISNFGMYVMVVYWIKKNSLSQSNHKNREQFCMYIKLSTITGISWLSYIPVFFTESNVWDILFSVLVASQGIFIMLAFICNRRVLMMCKQFISDKRTNSSTTKETRSKESFQKPTNISKNNTISNTPV